MKTGRPGRGLRLFNLCVVGLMLLAALPTMAAGQEPVPADRAVVPTEVLADTARGESLPPATVDDAGAQQPAASGDSVSACTVPPPHGNKARLKADAEMIVSLVTDSAPRGLRQLVYNQDTASPYNLSEVTADRKVWSTGMQTGIQWPVSVAANLAGTGHMSYVSVFKDTHNDLFVQPSPGTNGTDYWEMNNRNRYDGTALRYLSAVSADVDKWTTDRADELFVAFRSGYYEDLWIAGLDGTSGGDIATGVNALAWEWGSCGTYGSNCLDGTADVTQVNLAAADLDGDGYKNELVTCFIDGNRDLRCETLRPNDSGGMDRLSKYAFVYSAAPLANLDHGIAGERTWLDMAAGDLDADFQDEIVIAVRDDDFYLNRTPCRQGKITLATLDPTADGWTGSNNSPVILRRDPIGSFEFGTDYTSCTAGAAVADMIAPYWISVTTGDFDGDGREEVGLGYEGVVLRCDIFAASCARRRLQAHVEMLELGTSSSGAPALNKAAGWDWDKSNDSRGPVRVAAGDTDYDGKAELGVVMTNPGRTILEATVFNYAVSDSTGALSPAPSAYYSPGTTISNYDLAMGDVDGDTAYLEFTNECTTHTQAMVNALIHVPPDYPRYNHRGGTTGGTTVGMGKAVTKGGATEESFESSYGGSVTLDGSVSLDNVAEIGPSFSYGLEYTAESSGAVTQQTSNGLHLASDQGLDFVAYDEIQFRDFKYRNTSNGQPVTVTVALAPPALGQNMSVDYWYKDGSDGGRARFGASWVPVGINLARGQPATQSATWEGYEANLAVDGNTDGNLQNGSLSHTDSVLNARWQVDLRRVQRIDAVQVWNRTDCCSDRLTDFYVFVSPVPFNSTDLAATRGQAGVWSRHYTGTAGRPTTIPVGLWPSGTPKAGEPVKGRYVRVQLAGTNYLSLAEVEVYGRPQTVFDWRPLSSPGTPWYVDGREWAAKPPTTATGGFWLEYYGTKMQWVPGELKWKFNMNGGVGNQYIVVEPGQVAVAQWDNHAGTDWSTTQTSGFSNNMTWGFEAKLFGVGEEVNATYGTSRRTSRTTSWGSESWFDGWTGSFIENPAMGCEYPLELGYHYSPYLYVERRVAPAGFMQEYMVLDYWADMQYPGAIPATAPPVCPLPLAQAAGGATAPAAPLISSPSHPDPGAWYADNQVDLQWSQPAGDPATVVGYRWYLNRDPDMGPIDYDNGPSTSTTAEDVADGLWYMHVRAHGEDDAWSEPASRAVRIDMQPPVVALASDPPTPSGNNGWYRTPLTVTLTAEDAASGVQSVEYSTDGENWQPYAAPVQFAQDTAGTTVWGRATDAVGHVSTPISLTFKLDMTPPSSKIKIGEQVFGVWVAHVISDTLGNQQLELGGALSDALSGWAGMQISADGENTMAVSATGAWHPFEAQPEIEVNWYYTDTVGIGRGNHIFTGQAVDMAGNMEEPYPLVQMIWFPKAAPELAASSMHASQKLLRPGGEVSFDIVVRNGGLQEARVAVTDTVPAGLTPVAESLGDAVWDAGARTIVWPARLLWPGRAENLSFSARVDAGAPAGKLVNQATAHAFWPNTDSLTGAQRQYFRDRERTVSLAASVEVRPDLPADADLIAPQPVLYLGANQVGASREVALTLAAEADAQKMWLREWTLNPLTGAWQIAQDSGWLPYAQTYNWVLSAGDGVKYLGVWVADGASNVSQLDDRSLAFTNVMGSDQEVPAGGKLQYRLILPGHERMALYANVLAGDPDLFAWQTLNSFRPNHYSNGSGGEEYLLVPASSAEVDALYLAEVHAAGTSSYRLRTLFPDGADRVPGWTAAASMTLEAKAMPEHPLTVSDPLSAGVSVEAPDAMPNRRYLPLISR